MEDFFIQAIADQRILSGEDADKLRYALSKSFSMDGCSLDWSERPLSKKWYVPRRGIAGFRQLLADFPVAPRTTVYLCRDDHHDVVVEQFENFSRHPDGYWQEGKSLLIIPDNGRWIAGLTSDGYLYFDFSIPDEKSFSGLFGACPIG